LKKFIKKSREKSYNPREGEIGKENLKFQFLVFSLVGMVLVSALELNQILAVAAENATDNEIVEVKNADVNPDTGVNNKDVLELGTEDLAAKKIKLEIEKQEKEIEAINKSIQDTLKSIEEKRYKIRTLDEQIEFLSLNIELKEDVIRNVEQQIKIKENDVWLVSTEIELLKEKLDKQKAMLQEYLAVLYKEQLKFGLNEKDFDALKLLLSEESTEELLKEYNFSVLLEETGRSFFEGVQLIKEKLEANEKELKANQRQLLTLRKSLIAEKIDLDSQKVAKEGLLEQTKGEEEVYQELLRISKQQQEEAENDLNSLVKNLDFVLAKIRNGENYDAEKFASILQLNGKEALEEFLKSYGSFSDEINLRWPVSPSRGITAYFREESYARFFKMQHNAIDIRAYQNTPIRAPADGVVFRAKDNGFGYSYLILAHENGFMTVYGHVSKFAVANGDKVSEGQVVGFSGGMPGSRGAGLYTTGPHLHFEIIKNGKHVDPLLYMNLAYLNFESLPAKYQAKALGDKQKVKREIERKENLEESVDNTENSVSEEIDVMKLIEMEGGQSE